MKKSLVKAPLVHAVLDLRFAEVPSLKLRQKELEQQLHERMIDIGFPEKIISKSENFDFEFNQDFEKFTHRKYDIERLLFRASGERKIIEISSSSIQLKSTEYSSFEDFYDLFKNIVLSVNSIFNLDKSLIKSLELRYIDVIVPTKDYQLHDFVDCSYVKPTSLKDFTQIHGQKASILQTQSGQLIVNFSEIPVKDSKIIQILPNDLMEPDEKCTLLIEGQNEWLNVLSNTYGILDMRHIHKFHGSPTFSIEKLDNEAKILYNDISKIFWNTLSEIALNEWELKEE
jgi:uncharacterized protein (TIGR04255 family)